MVFYCDRFFSGANRKFYAFFIGAHFLQCVQPVSYTHLLGSNVSLDQIRTDLELPEELPGYGIQVAWESERPELLSSMGLLNQEGLWGVDPSRGETFSLMAELSCGEEKELVTVPITVLPEEMTQGDVYKRQQSGWP